MFLFWSLNMKRWATITFACLAMFSIAGCSGETPGGAHLKNLVAVSGVVTLDDKPLARAMVTFSPKTSSGFHGAYAITDDSGKYELETDAGKGETAEGVAPGSYNVTVSKFLNADGTPVKMDPNVPPMSQGMSKQAVPMKYSTVNDMGLFFTVPAGGGTYDIKMTSD
jgi:hypothetical protein